MSGQHGRDDLGASLGERAEQLGERQIGDRRPGLSDAVPGDDAPAGVAGLAGQLGD